MEPTPFVRLRLEGQRFDGPGMPVEALAELVAYRELLLDVGREVFYRNHPERQRLPGGFGDRLQLRLRRVEAGSAIPVLERISHDPQAALLPRDDEFTDARQLIEDAIVAVGAGLDLPPAFPPDAVGYFNRFGRTLRPGEVIVLSRPGEEAQAARYTPEVRRRLVLSRARTYRSNRTVIGRIVETNAESSTFTLRSEDRDAITCHYEWELFSFIRDALQQDGAGPAVAVEGEAVLDDRDRIQRMVVTEVTHAEESEESTVDSEAVRSASHDLARTKLIKRINELASLQDGWFDAVGQAPDPQVVATLRSIASDLTAEGMPSLGVFPTPEGGIQLEWRAHTVEHSIEIRADLGIYAIDVDTASGDTRELEHERFDTPTLLRLLRGGVGA